MANGTNGTRRKRKSPQRGVQAVFTPNTDWKGKAQLALGLASILVGIGAWTYTTRVLDRFGMRNVVPWNEALSVALLPISIPLLIGGVGLCTYYFAMRRTWRATNRIESALYELEALVGEKNGLRESSVGSGASSGIPTARKSRLSWGSGAIAFALSEAFILLVIYSGLVQEYVSNSNMQSWVRANFAPVSYLLSYNAVFALAGVLGVMFFQLLPRRIRSKKIQDQL